MRHDLLSAPGSSAYQAATTPHNSPVAQEPAMVARPHTAEEVAEVVRLAAERNLGVAVQASGHGAGAPVGVNRVLVDTCIVCCAPQLAVPVDVPGPFLLHAVGLAADPGSRGGTERGLAQVQAAAQSADVGLAAASFAEGRGAVGDGLPPDALRRLAAVRAELDPDRRVAPSRMLAASE